MSSGHFTPVTAVRSPARVALPLPFSSALAAPTRMPPPLNGAVGHGYTQRHPSARLPRSEIEAEPGRGIDQADFARWRQPIPKAPSASKPDVTHAPDSGTEAAPTASALRMMPGVRSVTPPLSKVLILLVPQPFP